MCHRPPLIGAILTGGASRRFGADKAAVIGPLVLAAMRGAGIDPIVAVGGAPDALPIPTLADRYPGQGPLGGIATVLTYARTGWVMVVPCDHPGLEPSDLRPFVERLDTLEPDVALVATIAGEPRHSLACWPASFARAANFQLREGHRQFRRVLDLGRWEGIPVREMAVADADEPEDLARFGRDGKHTTEDPKT